MIDASPDSFKHEPLPTKTSIRLVYMVRTEQDKTIPSLNFEVPQIQLALETVDLQDNALYGALSYTWGSPFPDSNEKAKAYQGVNSQRPILVNNQVYYIGQNLYQFLHQSQQAFDNVDKKTQPYNKTELIEAAELGDSDRTHACLRKGADLTAQDGFGETALHYVAEDGHFEVVRLLVYCDFDTSCLDSTARTPLDCVKQRKRRQYAKVIDFLEKSNPL